MTGWIEDELGLPIYTGSHSFVATSTTWDSLATQWDAGGTIWDPSATLLPTLADANLSGDILLLWDNNNAIGDWQLADGDLQTGQDLETACLVSLFTDKLATPDYMPTDGTTDRRGWWADPYNDQPLGSNLWQLARAKKTRDTLGLARTYALDALQCLITDGVAAQVDCNTMWLGGAGSTMLGIALAIIKPDGSLTRFTFGWAWQGLATLPSPVFVPPVPMRQLRMTR
jgi:phage gp46-like protein